VLVEVGAKPSKVKAEEGAPKPPTKAKAKEAVDTFKQEFTLQMMKSVPQLLKKYQADPVRPRCRSASALGDVKGSLGDVKSSLGDAHIPGVAGIVVH
jgi:hypothetical protein